MQGKGTEVRRVPLVRLSMVSKDFGTVRAVNQVSLDLAKGEIMALLGPSGCGKSTMLRLIAGFERPDEGTIEIDGRVVASPSHMTPPEQRGVGMVFQDYALFPHLTVEQNVAFGLNRLSRRQRAQRTAELLEQVGLQGLGKRYPYELSGGQQQRVALARAMAPDPAVILLDEPFSNLDASLRQQMRDQIRRILKSVGSTAILVTHDQKDAFVVADRVAVMNQGQLLQVGTAKELYTRPANEFVASFVGHSNMLRGRFLATEGCIATELGTLPCSVTSVQQGDEVTVCLSPRFLCLDPEGTITGRVVSTVFEGTTIETVVAIPLGEGERHFVMHLDPDQNVQPDDIVRLSIKPRDIALVG